MAQQTINVGTAPNDGTGTPLRTAFQYTNSNFSELYTAVGPSGNNIVVPGSATITGDLTVDTSTLKVDSVNNRVGIGTASPNSALEVAGSIRTTNAGGSASASTGVFDYVAGTTTRLVSYGANTTTAGAFQFTGLSSNASVGDIRYGINATGIHTWSNVGGVAGTAMTLNSTGLGVGTTNYIGKIQAAGLVAAADPTFGTSGTFIGAILNNDNTAPGLDLRRWTGAAANHGTTYISTDYTGNTYFYNGQQASNTKATALRLLINTNGVLVFNGGNASSNGVGINFPATQVASSDANTLDDYEEGTFTPTVVGATSAGTATYSAQTGYYTKVGRLVTVQVYMAWSGHTGTGDMRFAGLPFNSANIANNYAAVAFGFVSNFALTANNVMVGHTELGNSFINVLQTPAGGGAISNVPVDAAATVVFTCSYMTA